VFVQALPKNNYGKILKTELREIDGRRAPRADG
jgi:acyl-coenzyme A synthetase/AMP-(fatty) acid ligase